MNQYNPDTVAPPGDTLQELLEERGLSTAELAKKTGLPIEIIEEIVEGKTEIDPTIAIQLESVLGTPARIWNNLEAAYCAHISEKLVKEVRSKTESSEEESRVPKEFWKELLSIIEDTLAFDKRYEEIRRILEIDEHK